MSEQETRAPSAESTPRRRPRSLSWWRETVRQARLAWRLFIDRRVPWLAKLVPPAALGYVIFPVDILPDMILGLGQVDDLAILLLGVKLFIELCPTELVTEHLRALGAQLQEQQAEQVVEGEYEVIDPGGQ